VEWLLRIDFTLPAILFNLFGYYSPLFTFFIEFRFPHHNNYNQFFLNVHFEISYFEVNQGGQTQQTTPASTNETLVPTNEVE
jgi:hypothetical protein